MRHVIAHVTMPVRLTPEQFGVDLTGVRLEAVDSAWDWGNGRLVRADSGSLVALSSGRALPDGRTLPRR